MVDAGKKAVKTYSGGMHRRLDIAASIVKYAIAVVGVVLIGLAIGFLPEGGVIGLVLGMFLVTMYAFSLSWVFAAIGVVVKRPESVSQNSMLILYISIFASNIFTDASTMPNWLQTIIRSNPTTHIVTETRYLMQGGEPSLITIVFVLVGMIAVFAPLTFVLYSRKDKR